MDLKTLLNQCYIIFTSAIITASLQFFLIPLYIYLQVKNDGTNSTAIFPMVLVPWYTGTGGIRFYTGISYLSILAAFVLLSFSFDAFIVTNAYVAARLSNLLSFRFQQLTFDQANELKMINLIKQHQKLGDCIRNFKTIFESYLFTSFMSDSIMFATLTFQLYSVKPFF